MAAEAFQNKIIKAWNNLQGNMTNRCQKHVRISVIAQAAIYTVYRPTFL